MNQTNLTLVIVLDSPSIVMKLYAKGHLVCDSILRVWRKWYRVPSIRGNTLLLIFSGRNLTLYEFLQDRIVFISKSWSIGVAKPIQHVILGLTTWAPAKHDAG